MHGLACYPAGPTILNTKVRRHPRASPILDIGICRNSVIMPRLHLARVGVMAAVGRFAAADAGLYAQNSRVVVRTARHGLEIGEVLAPPDDVSDTAEVDGTIVRAMTVEDRLLEATSVQEQPGRLPGVPAAFGRARPLGMLDGRGTFVRRPDARVLFPRPRRRGRAVHRRTGRDL